MKKVNLIVLVLGLTLAFATQSFTVTSERYYYQGIPNDLWIAESELAQKDLQGVCDSQTDEVCSAVFASDPDQGSPTPLEEEEGNFSTIPIQ